MAGARAAGLMGPLATVRLLIPLLILLIYERLLRLRLVVREAAAATRVATVTTAPVLLLCGPPRRGARRRNMVDGQLWRFQARKRKEEHEEEMARQMARLRTEWEQRASPEGVGTGIEIERGGAWAVGACAC